MQNDMKPWQNLLSQGMADSVTGFEERLGQVQRGGREGEQPTVRLRRAGFIRVDGRMSNEG